MEENKKKNEELEESGSEKNEEVKAEEKENTTPAETETGSENVNENVNEGGNSDNTETAPGNENSGNEGETIGTDNSTDPAPEAEASAEASSETAPGDTLTPSVDENPGENNVADETNPEGQVAEKMLTQSQVNELVGRARQEGRESAMKELYGRYGVGGDDELNDLFGKGQMYGELNDEFGAQGNSYKLALAENALLKSKIDEARWDDVKAILGSKGLEVTPENIESMLPTHQEWRGQEVVTPEMAEAASKNPSLGVENNNTQPATIRKLGNEVSENQELSEEDRVKKLFGM